MLQQLHLSFLRRNGEGASTYGALFKWAVQWHVRIPPRALSCEGLCETLFAWFIQTADSSAIKPMGRSPFFFISPRVLFIGFLFLGAPTRSMSSLIVPLFHLNFFTTFSSLLLKCCFFAFLPHRQYNRTSTTSLRHVFLRKLAIEDFCRPNTRLPDVARCLPIVKLPEQCVDA